LRAQLSAQEFSQQVVTAKKPGPMPGLVILDPKRSNVMCFLPFDRSLLGCD